MLKINCVLNALLSKTKYQSFDDFKHTADSCSKEKLNKLKLPEVKNKHILDIGCNTGYFCIKLTQLGGKCCGIDNSLQAIKLANKWAKIYKLNINFICANIFEFQANEKKVLAIFQIKKHCLV